MRNVSDINEGFKWLFITYKFDDRMYYSKICMV